jgi:hypothetical protein
MKIIPSSFTHRWLHALVALALLGWSLRLPAAGAAPDLDGDGVPNIVDPDVDNDGIPNALDRNIDGGIAKTGPYAGQYIGDHIENENPAEDDIDDDGLADESLAEMDVDGDGRLDDSDLEDDIDGDNRKDDSGAERDIDGDGKDDDSDDEDDIDGDGRDDDDPEEQDIDGDGRLDGADDDEDGDGKKNGDADEDDIDGDGRSNVDPDEHDDDGDGTEDRYDDDDDNDGLGDIEEPGHAGDADEAEVELKLTRLAAAPGGSEAKAKYRRLATGMARLKVEVDDLAAGNYELFVGGVSRGQIVLSEEGGGDRVFKTTPSGDAVLLDFEVAGQPILIQRDGQDYFSGIMPAVPDSTKIGGSGSRAVHLSPAGAAPAGAEAKVELEFGGSGPVQLQVELEDFPAGDYKLVIADVLRGTISVNGDSGVLTFKVNPVGAELPLDFPTVGQNILINEGSTVLFSGVLPTPPAP